MIWKKLANKMLKAYVLSWIILTHRWKPGKNIYNKQWDVLIVLDACRADALREVKEEYSFVNNIETYWSVGSTSKEWLDRTFIPEYSDKIRQTNMITANSFAEHLSSVDDKPLAYNHINDNISNHLSAVMHNQTVHSKDFQSFVSLFSDFVGDPVDQLHPQVVTDIAIRKYQKDNTGRWIIHYMQPHQPYFPLMENNEDIAYDPFKYLSETGNHALVWEAYIDNLRFVLDQVEILLNNISAEKVIITSDHGELFGECGLYSHIAGIPHPALRKVPKVETSASNSGSHIPEEYNLSGTSDGDQINERLDALGYL